MNTKTPRNLLSNASFERGTDAPTGWQWVVSAGQPEWAFDTKITNSRGRSIRIFHDGMNWLGEFQQRVKLRKTNRPRRYRISGWIRSMTDGAVDGQNGASLYLRSFAGDREIHDMYFRPFLLGINDQWQYWWMEYCPPAEATSLLVSFDMRGACGQSWFDDLCLCEVPAPAWRSRMECDIEDAATRRHGHAANKIVVLCDAEPEYLVRKVLAPLVGAKNVSVVHRAQEVSEADAVLVTQQGNKPVASWSQIEGLRRRCDVIVTPEVVAAAAGVRLMYLLAWPAIPTATIVQRCALTSGFSEGDVLPFSQRGPEFFQPGLIAGPRTWEKLGLRIVATSGSGRVPHALLLEGAGLSVMDLGMLNYRPDAIAHENLAAVFLCNALGRPPAYFGRYACCGWPQFDYADIVSRLQSLSKRRPSIALKEEGRTRDGLAVLSLTLGPAKAPTLYIDCAVHSDEWGPAIGAMLYLDRLAAEFEAGRPWARALLSRFRIKCIPVLSPDGWNVHRRYIRGLDLNRNFPIFWDETSPSRKGPAPLSEPETQIVSRIFREENVVASQNWHETTAATNWVGIPRTGGRYAKYASAVPPIMRQLIDGRWLSHKASTWTQIFDFRNHHWQKMDSWPYVRDYSPQRAPYQLPYAESLGIEALTMEQYGNSDITCSDSVSRTDITGCIIEMLLGMQLGLLTRNYGFESKNVEVPLPADAAGCQQVFAPDGQVISRKRLRPRDGSISVKAQLEPGQVLLVELEQPG